ncbi:hypothetical protein KKF61_04795 [Patescibacteria group bacterium]|nr:hypothetical protein [Patescibacteria group bacterium]
MLKYSPSSNALRMAKQYLQHEFRKIFGDIKDDKTWKKIDRSINNFNKREDDGVFWNLIAAISEDLKLKRVYYILSSTKYRWTLRQIKLSEILLTGMSPTINKYTIKKFRRNPLLFAQAWKKDKHMREVIKKTGFKTHPARDHFPIFIYKTPQGLQIFDGMRRTLLASIKNKKTIKAWIGNETNPKGKSLISGGRCHFLANIHEQANNHNKSLDKAIVRIGQEIMTTYRNGHETLTKRIAGWSYDPKIKQIIKQMEK